MRRRCRKADMPQETNVQCDLLTRSFDTHSFRAGHRQVPITISPFSDKKTQKALDRFLCPSILPVFFFRCSHRRAALQGVAQAFDFGDIR